MKVLVATKESQGGRGNDFCFCEEGELVKFGLECGREEVDGSCGCRRALSGMKTSKATTTMKVAETDLTLDELHEQLRASEIREGWLKAGEPLSAEIWALFEYTLRLASALPVGTIVERRKELQQRNWKLLGR